MQKGTIKLIAFLMGMLLALMTIFNSMLGVRTTQEASLIANHIVGIAVMSVLIAAGRNNAAIRPKPGKLAWYLHFGGLFGVVLMLFNNIAVLGCGATVAMASAVFGQCFTGLLFDCTGFLGMKKRPLTKRKLLSLAVSCLGIMIMVFLSGEAFSLLYVLMAFLAGALLMTQMVHNSFVSARKGPFFSALLNNTGGLIALTLLAVVIKPEATLEGLKALGTVNPLLVAAGGGTGIIITTTVCTIIPKIPGAVSSLLMSAGQILAGLPLDYLLFHRFSPALLIGAIVMVLGLVLDKAEN